MIQIIQESYNIEVINMHILQMFLSNSYNDHKSEVKEYVEDDKNSDFERIQIEVIQKNLYKNYKEQVKLEKQCQTIEREVNKLWTKTTKAVEAYTILEGQYQQLCKDYKQAKEDRRMAIDIKEIDQRGHRKLENEWRKQE